MYKIVNSKYDGQTGKRVCDVYAPTVDDLPTLANIKADFIDVGSWAWCGEDRTFKTLNDNFEWI